MLEGLVAWVLNTYLGKYVNNLNTDQLSVALLKGAVELENLPLKKDALKELELPFEVKAGLIGKVTLQIPFYRPHVDPWVISISGLHVIGGPEKIQDFNDEKEKLLERERKKALLQALEERWKSERRQQKGEPYWYSVTASVVTRIVENIELKIQDVHLRFEDGVTNPSRPFAFGICIKNVSMQNAANEPVQKLMRKKRLDVAEFSIYWDVNCTLLGDLPQAELQEAMARSMDCDVPLAELTFSRLNFLQHIRTNPEGFAHFTLSGDYYNRALSGWEPFIEPWPCSVSWQQQASSRLHPPRLKLEAKAKRRLDINITSVLIDQYISTKESWLADYCKEDKETESAKTEDWMGSSVDPPCFGQTEVKTPKRRQPFVPFALRNHTGCTLWFATLTTTPTRAALSHSGSPGVVPEGNGAFLDDAHNVSEWREVLTGEEIPFEFEARGKLRHRHTHDLRIHQLQVRVNGWEQVSPVSVDKVGTFFRYAAPDKNSSSSTIGSPSCRCINLGKMKTCEGLLL